MSNLHVDSQPQPGEVAAAFDRIAEIFDSTFEVSPVIQRLRPKIYSEIESRVKPGATLLDINCGTGIDAIYLAQHEMKMAGVDISPNMIEQAEKKIDALRLTNIQFFVSSFEHLPRSINTPYDLVFSNFGGLNCVEYLDRVAKEISAVTKPQGYFIGIIMPPFSLWETLAGVKRGQWRYAFRRLKNHTTATGFQGKVFNVFYHSPAYVKSVFQPWFSTERVIGFNTFSPPPSASSFVTQHPHINSLLVRFDELLERFPFIRSIGDHYMIILKRKTR